MSRTDLENRKLLPCLDPEAVYRAPSGRNCRVRVSTFEKPQQGVATLVYDLQDGTPGSTQFGEGFALTRENWHLLKQVG